MRIRPMVAGVAVGLATAAVMLATEPLLVIGWDEGYVLGREARLRDWFRALADPPGFAARWRPPPLVEDLVQQDRPVPLAPPTPDRLNSRAKLLFDREVLAWFWPFAREEPHGHPPFYCELGLVGDLLVPSWPVLPRARLAPILLFSLTAGAIFAFVAARWGYGAAALAAGSWVFQPNLFGHGHYAAYDAVLSALWILAIIAYSKAVIPRGPGSAPIAKAARWSWTVAFGLILGCAAALKLTGWFLPLPFLAWAAWARDRRAFTVVLAGMLIAAVVVLVLMPPWWTDPIGGVYRFFFSNLTRSQSQPIEVEFLGKVYKTPEKSLPWYNTIVWTVMVTPVGFLAFGMLGLAAAVSRRRSEPIGLLIAGHWAFLMILRALPHTPGHDGVRLFLPAFGLLALLGGLGVRVVLDRSVRWGTVAIVAALAEGIASVAVMMPMPLSYFSPVVGGLPGAAVLGMEPTYYWDALTPDARRWLAEHTPPGRTFLFATNPTSWLYLRQTGELPRRLFPLDPNRRFPDPPRWYIMQNRTGAFFEVDQALAKQGRAEYIVRKLGVPLVWIFPYEEYERLAPRRGPSAP
jgi:4-amino-4-deoxy-L-arabinose transferase-like glycosyltransferase